MDPHFTFYPHIIPFAFADWKKNIVSKSRHIGSILLWCQFWRSDTKWRVANLIMSAKLLFDLLILNIQPCRDLKIRQNKLI